MLNQQFCCRQSIQCRRAILKALYQFGIPNSDPQTLKSVDFWCKLSSPYVVAEPRERCFQLFRMQNSQNFPGLRPWTSLGRTYSVPQTPQLHNGFSLRYTRRKPALPKNTGYGTGISPFFRFKFLPKAFLYIKTSSQLFKYLV